MLKEILIMVVMLLSIPVGYLVAWMARDELIVGRKWFKAMMALSIVAGIIFFFYGIMEIAWTLLFILIATFISYRKSFDKKWTKKRV